MSAPVSEDTEMTDAAAQSAKIPATSSPSVTNRAVSTDNNITQADINWHSNQLRNYLFSTQTPSEGGTKALHPPSHSQAASSDPRFTAKPQEVGSHTTQRNVLYERIRWEPEKTQSPLGNHPVFPPRSSVPRETMPQKVLLDSKLRIEHTERLTEVLRTTPASVAREVIRQHWRSLIFEGSEKDDHAAWLIRAGLKNANSYVLERVIKDDALFKPLILSHLGKKRAVIQSVLSQLGTNELSTNMLFESIPEKVLDQAFHDKLISPEVLDRALRERLNSHLEDLLPEQVVDRVLRQRLTQLPAKDLIRWLAEADRLGFKHDDILNDEDESVMPNIETEDKEPIEILNHDTPIPPTRPQTQMLPSLQETHSRPAAQVSTDYGHDDLLVEQEKNRQSQPHQQQQEAAKKAKEKNRRLQVHQQQQEAAKKAKENNRRLQVHQQEEAAMKVQERNVQLQRQQQQMARLTCPQCGYEFDSQSGYNYHVQRKLCLKQGPEQGYKDFCLICAQGFSTKQGLQYHSLNRVCESDGQANGAPDAASRTPPTQPPQQAQQSSGALFPTQVQPLRGSEHPTQAPARPPQVQTQITQSQPSQSTPRLPATYVTPDSSTPKYSNVPQPAALPEGIRFSPSELSPLRLAELNARLAGADARYQNALVEAARLPEPEKGAKFVSLKQGHATRKSQIRKNFGVSLRLRENEKSAREQALAQVAAASSFATIDNTSSPGSATDNTSVPPNTYNHNSAKLKGRPSRFQLSVSPTQYNTPTNTQPQAPTSNFSPINSQNKTPIQTTQRPNISVPSKPPTIRHPNGSDAQQQPHQPSQVTPSESSSAFLYRPTMPGLSPPNAGPAGVVPANNDLKRGRSDSNFLANSGERSAYFDAHPPRQISPFIAQANAASGQPGVGLEMRQVYSEDAAEALARAKQKNLANRGASQSGGRREIGGQIETGGGMRKQRVEVVRLDSSSDEERPHGESSKNVPKPDVPSATPTSATPLGADPANGDLDGEKRTPAEDKDDEMQDAADVARPSVEIPAMQHVAEHGEHE